MPDSTESKEDFMFSTVASVASTAAPYAGRAAVAGTKAVAGLVAAKKLADYAHQQIGTVRDEVEDLVGEFREEDESEDIMNPTLTQERKVS